MKKEYDFSNARLNPYGKKLEKQITERLASNNIDARQAMEASARELFGLRKTHDDEISVDDVIRTMRRGRQQ